jgi:hypothetical protein
LRTPGHGAPSRYRLTVDDMTRRASETRTDLLLVGGMKVSRISNIDRNRQRSVARRQ